MSGGNGSKACRGRQCPKSPTTVLTGVAVVTAERRGSVYRIYVERAVAAIVREAYPDLGRRTVSGHPNRVAVCCCECLRIGRLGRGESVRLRANRLTETWKTSSLFKSRASAAQENAHVR